MTTGSVFSKYYIILWLLINKKRKFHEKCEMLILSAYFALVLLPLSSKIPKNGNEVLMC